MKISKKQLSILIEDVLREQSMDDDTGPFGEIFPNEEYFGLVESTKAHLDRVLANLDDMMKLSGDTPGYDLEHVRKRAAALKRMVETLW